MSEIPAGFGAICREGRRAPEIAVVHDAPTIRIVGGQLSDIATEGERAIIAAKMPIYSRDNSLVRPVIEEVDAAHGRRTHVARLVPIDTAHLRDLLCRCARWERFAKREREWFRVDAPHEVAATILARFGEWAFPSVSGVISTPTMRPDGSLFATAGYDTATRLLLVAPPALPAMPSAPSRADALSALALLNGLLAEFVFTDDASRSVGLSALITPVVRAAFPVAPMHLVRAPTAGSGKSYLLDVAAAIAIGQVCPVIAAGRDEAETEKRLGAALMAGQPIISIDNVTGELSGDALCQVIERPVVQIRVLGRSELVRCEARGTTLFATGNNPTLRGDITRRVVTCTLDTKLEQPELRQFAGNPVQEVLADRGKYIAAALTIAIAYRIADRPNPAPRLGSFEGWSDTVRSALIWLGCADPVDTMARARADDPELSSLRAMLAAWKDAFGIGYSTARTLADVLKTANETVVTGTGDGWGHVEREHSHPELRDAVAAVAVVRGRADARAFGYWARRYKDRVVDGCRLTGQVNEHGHAAKWWLENV